MLQKLVLGLLAVLWSTLFFALGLHLTFPGQAARDRLVYEVDAMTRGSMQLQLADVSPWRGTGLSLSDARLLSVEKPRRGQEPAPPSLLLTAQQLSARVNLLSLLRGTPAATVHAELYGGDLGGVVGQDGDAVVVDLTGRELDLGLYPFESEDYSLDLGGRLQLRADLVYDQVEVKNSDGKLRFEIKDLRLGEGSKVMGFELPAANFTEAVLSFDIDKGKGRVKKGHFVGDLLNLEIEGDVTLSAPVLRSRLDLDLSLDVHDSALDSMLGMVAGKAKASDGAYKAQLGGTLERPSFRWDGGKPSARTTSRPSSRGVLPPIDEDGPRNPPPPVDEADDEARRGSRQDRIRERRERLRTEREGEAQRPSSSADDEGDFEDGDFEEGEFDEIDFDEPNFEDFDEGDFDEGDFEPAAPIDPSVGGPAGGDERLRGLPEPEYDDVPPPDFSNDRRPGE